MGYRVINGKIYPVNNYSNFIPKNNNSKNVTSSTNFKDVLKKHVNDEESFVISNHAAQRLQSRNISLDTNDMKNINEGINKAVEKSCQECLILYKDIALVASVKNRTIITAVDKDSSKGNVFTNIDSVVIL